VGEKKTLKELKLFEDIRRASELILEFASDKAFTDYQNDALLRSGV